MFIWPGSISRKFRGKKISHFFLADVHVAKFCDTTIPDSEKRITFLTKMNANRVLNGFKRFQTVSIGIVNC